MLVYKSVGNAAMGQRFVLHKAHLTQIGRRFPLFGCGVSRAKSWRLCDFALTSPKKNTKKAQQAPNPKTGANASPSLTKLNRLCENFLDFLNIPMAILSNKRYGLYSRR